jgi:hypothetical protein
MPAASRIIYRDGRNVVVITTPAAQVEVDLDEFMALAVVRYVVAEITSAAAAPAEAETVPPFLQRRAAGRPH